MIARNHILWQSDKSDIINGTVEIPSYIKIIKDYAFASYQDLQQIRIP